ncbi:protein HGV2-like [Gigantopelta aegis]|uniref:protein HGV2-like n=1 Tax=Gigantopelta aegis TaxID=1735272 RepID=UPI001B88B8CA|nr:protein HGV2-like [Gigantopelta aegis]
MDEVTRAVGLVAQGRRNIICGEIPAAVNQFQEACKMFASHYGETAKECAEAYFYYGQALLELARMETGVLGNALQGVDVEEEKEEEEKPEKEGVEGPPLTDEERFSLRVEVVEAMAEEKKDKAEENGDGTSTDKKESKESKENGDKKSTTEIKNEVEKSIGKESDSTQDKMETDEEVMERKEKDEKESSKDEKLKDKPDEEVLSSENKEEAKNVEAKQKNADESKVEDAKLVDKKSDDTSKILIAKRKDEKAETVVENSKESTTVKNNSEEPDNKTTDMAVDKSKHETEAETGKLKEKESKKDEEVMDNPRKIVKRNLLRKKVQKPKLTTPSQWIQKKRLVRKVTKNQKPVRRRRREEEGEEEGEEGEETAEDEEGEVTGDKKDEEDEDADDVPNLQLAWEMLELSKMIYIKEEDKESKLKLAQSYLKLGEVSLETENYEQSVADFKECLTLQEKYLEPTDRLLAETHYQLGLAYGFDKQFDCAIEHYKAAVNVIESKIEQLTKLIEEKSTTKGKELATPDDPVSNAAQEIKEFKEILPDIVSKVEDSEEEKKNHDQLKKMAKEAMGGVFPQSGASSGDTAARIPKTEVKALDVNLIRRKRKPEEDGVEDGDSKKSKQENGSGDVKKIKENGPSEEKIDSKVQSSNIPEPMATS